MRSAAWQVTVALLAFFTSASRASILVAMSEDASAETSYSVRVSSAQQPAISFTLPGQEYRVDAVTLNLRDYASASDAPVIGFYVDNRGRPGSMLGGPLINPPSSSTRSGDFTFLPSGSLILKPGETYWVKVSSSFGSFSWNAPANDVLNPRTPFGEASFHSYKVGLNYGEVFVEDSPIPAFTISATAVPEPVSIALFLVGSCAFLRGRGWRKK